MLDVDEKALSHLTASFHTGRRSQGRNLRPGGWSFPGPDPTMEYWIRMFEKLSREPGSILFKLRKVGRQ